jgi:hypothetical protein
MEKIEVLNQRLIDYYGMDTVTGQAMFRIVWANDETEKRLVYELESGVELLYPMVMEVKKYPYLKNLHVLERLVVVPDEQQKDLPANKLSYEPIWAYRSDDNRPLYPIWKATKFIVDTLYAALGKKSLAKYVEDEKYTTEEGREDRISELQSELFENETEVGDALAYEEGIVVPRNYEEEKEKERED